jgi:C4-type Zn-finger protein
MFQVKGTHTYATGGTAASFPVSVTIVDKPSGQTAEANSTAIVATPIAAIGTTFPATPGVPMPTTTVAYFSDANPAVINSGDPAGQITVLINWGDGQTSTGKVVLLGQTSAIDTFKVTGTHTYAPGTTAASLPVTVTIVDPSGQTAVANSTALLTTLIVATGTTFTATPGKPLIGQPVASFTDINPAANAGNITAVINWGDGQSSTGTISGPDANNRYTVNGNHTYATSSPAGSYKVTVTIVDPSGQTAIADSTAVVATFISASGTTFTAVPGRSTTQTVATFTDASPSAGSSSAVINWGDGQTSAGQVIGPDANGIYMVHGTHAYPASVSKGSYAVTVTIIDPSGQTAVANSTAIISAVSALNPIPATLYLTAGVLGGPVTVGSFFDTNPNAAAGQLTASINWGDGNVSPGTVTPSSSSPGLFLVSGSHLYVAPGNYWAVNLRLMGKVSGASGERPPE